MSAPDYLICLECESPVYVFEWKDTDLLECLCPMCGNEDLDQFLSPDDFDALAVPRA
ncbi:MAG: hypothetical protein AAF481_17980 [Acidobacteriota bacterium]